MDSIFVAYLGTAIALGLSGVGSIYGVSIAASAAVGAMKKNPEPFGYYLVLMTPPSTNGLYGFLGYFIFSEYLLPDITWFQASAIFSTCLALGILNFFSSIRQGQVCANAMVAISNGKQEIFGKSLILIAFIELYAIIGLAAVFLVTGVL